MPKKRDLSIKIDWMGMWSSIRDHWRLYCYVVPVVAVFSGIYALGQIDLYKSTTKLAPELNDGAHRAVMSLIASVSDSKAISKDEAINPTLYSEVVSSLKFRVGMLPVKVRLSDNREMTYYYYLINEQNFPWWRTIFADKVIYEPKPVDLFCPPGEQMIATGTMIGLVSCEVDPKTYTIKITVLDQDPVVSAQIADSVSTHLQQYITEYRANKARIDYEYYKKIQTEAKEKYEEASKAYTEFSDANRDILLEKTKSKGAALQEEMESRYKLYSKLTAEMITAEAKMQEAKPAFTTLQSATVPLKPSEPNRPMLVLICSFVAALLVTIYILYKEGDLYRLIVGGYKHEQQNGN